MRPTSSNDGISGLRSLQERAKRLGLEATSLNWASRLGLTIGFTERAAAEAFVASLAAECEVPIPEGEVFGRVGAPQVAWEIEFAGWEVRVYARNA